MKAIILNLIKRCSTDLPQDIEQALQQAVKQEEKGSSAARVLATIVDNIHLARAKEVPLCQDTGIPVFYAQVPVGTDIVQLQEDIRSAVQTATEKRYLRPNCVDPLSGRNTGDNTGNGIPVLKTAFHREQYTKISLILKGGGSENVSGQLKLPDTGLNAGRDIDGIRKAVLHLVHQAQGRGCAPGIIGVGIGGDRELSLYTAKKQLLRKLDATNSDSILAELENRLLDELNRLDIGPMGMGGITTVLGVKAAAVDRIPASYFVSVSYMCWAARRYTITIQPDGTYTYDS